MLFLRADQDGQQEIYMDYHFGKAVVYFGIQPAFRNAPIAEKPGKNDFAETGEKEDEEEIAWLL